MPLNAFEQGPVPGILVGEGHFGGDGEQAQITLRMHTRSLKVFDMLIRQFSAAKLYGPYKRGGRPYRRWMARGAVPLDSLPLAEIEGHVYGRYPGMELRCGL